MEDIQGLKNTIANQVKQIEELNAEVKRNKQELEKYKHVSGKLRHERHKTARYKRDRIILLVFSLLMFAAFCYQFNEQHKSVAEQERLQGLYKQQNHKPPPPGVLSSEHYFKVEEAERTGESE